MTKKTKKIVLISVLSILALVLILVTVFCISFADRISTIASITKCTDYTEGFNIYSMNVNYDYSLERIMSHNITDTESYFAAIRAEALDGLSVDLYSPDFGCCAFSLKTPDGDAIMSRNYDFAKNTSAMLVYCAPKDGYKSVALSALENLGANIPSQSIESRLACLTAPFICLDGMNEKGVSVVFLTLDSDLNQYDTEKDNICAPIAVRLILDRAATTEEAVELLKQYDMISVANRDFHLYISDASGDGRVVEWDPHSDTREMVVTPVRTVTNFYTIYSDRVKPDADNGIYGHGRDRYDVIEGIFDEADGVYTEDVAWDALITTAQVAGVNGTTSNTQWSVVYNNTDRTLDLVLHRKWTNVMTYDLATNTVKEKE